MSLPANLEILLLLLLSTNYSVALFALIHVQRPINDPKTAEIVRNCDRINRGCAVAPIIKKRALEILGFRLPIDLNFAPTRELE
jgi:hypothetical protein